ncbi:hypothetical protein ABIE52_006838 [Rhodococcus sp. OAS809]|uniref:hypothetical protein n=1 Tax=Rhodococcus sp. OAS809 TaxID=2663874 RepID=UPI00178B8E5A
MSETEQYAVKVRSIYEHTMTVEVDPEAYRDWCGENDSSVEEYIDSLLEEGDSVIIPAADEDGGEFYAYDIVSVEPIAQPAQTSEGEL